MDKESVKRNHIINILRNLHFELFLKKFSPKTVITRFVDSNNEINLDINFTFISFTVNRSINSLPHNSVYFVIFFFID